MPTRPLRLRSAGHVHTTSRLPKVRRKRVRVRILRVSLELASSCIWKSPGLKLQVLGTRKVSWSLPVNRLGKSVLGHDDKKPLGLWEEAHRSVTLFRGATGLFSFG